MIGAVLSSIVAVVIALAIVLALAWAVLWGLRQMQDRQLRGADANVDDRPLRFLRALPLGPRERIVLVEAGDETLLLGITGGGISLLARWPRSTTTAPGAALTLEPGRPQ
jgi:flagellar protein FliO/FliZ